MSYSVHGVCALESSTLVSSNQGTKKLSGRKCRFIHAKVLFPGLQSAYNTVKLRIGPGYSVATCMVGYGHAMQAGHAPIMKF